MNKTERIAEMAPGVREQHREAIIKYLVGLDTRVRATVIFNAIGIRLEHALMSAVLKLMVNDEEIRKDSNSKYYVDKPMLPWKTGLPRSRAKARMVTFPDDWAPQKGDPVRGGHAPYQRASIDAL